MTMEAATVNIEALAFWSEPEDMLVSVADGMFGSVVLVSKMLSVQKYVDLLVALPLDPLPVREAGELDCGG